MSWFGGGLSKLQNFTREVLSDVVESVQGNTLNTNDLKCGMDYQIVTRHHDQKIGGTQYCLEKIHR